MADKRKTIETNSIYLKNSTKNFMPYFDLILGIICISIIILQVRKYGINFPDFQYYQGAYDSIGSLGINNFSGMELGFKMICAFGNLIGLSYINFYYVLITFSYLLMFKAIKFFSKESSLVIFFYIIFPMALDMVQIRNLAATAIALFAIRYLSDRYSRKYIMIFLLLMFFSVSLQFTLVYYFVFVLAKFLKTKTTLVISGILAILFVGFSKYFETLLTTNNVTSKYANYFNESYLFQNEFRVGLIAILLIIANVLCLFYFSQTSDDFDKYKLIFKINLLLLPLMGILLINPDIFRLFRNLMLVNTALFVRDLFEVRKDFKRIFVYLTYLISFAGLGYIFLYLTNSSLVQLVF